MGRCGAPIANTRVMLSPIADIHENTNDSSSFYAKGHLLVASKCIMEGYMDSIGGVGDDGFYIHEDGRGYYKTGDIAVIHNDGFFEIIGRVKESIKLSNGEYISLSNIENVLKSSSKYILNIICAARNGDKNVVAIVIPSEQFVKSISQRDNDNDTFYNNSKVKSDLPLSFDFNEDPEIISKFMHEISTNTAIKDSLSRYRNF